MQPDPVPIHQPQSYVSTGFEKESRHSSASQREFRPVIRPSSPPTDYSSFPPLSKNPRDMTVVPEDSISRVIPPRHGLRDRHDRRSEDDQRGRTPYRRPDQDRRRQHTRSRRRTPQHSGSDSGSDSSSTTSRSQASITKSSPHMAFVRRHTLSPGIPSRRSSLTTPPLRMMSHAVSGTRPSGPNGFPYLAQPLPMSPMSPIAPRPPPFPLVHFCTPSVSTHQWSVPSSFSSANLPSHPATLAQWPSFGGTAAQIGTHPFSPPSQPYMSGMSPQGRQLGANLLQRRGSTMSAGVILPATTGGMRRQPTPSRSGSMPLPVERTSTGITKDRLVSYRSLLTTIS